MLRSNNDLQITPTVIHLILTYCFLQEIIAEWVLFTVPDEVRLLWLKKARFNRGAQMEHKEGFTNSRPVFQFKINPRPITPRPF